MKNQTKRIVFSDFGNDKRRLEYVYKLSSSLEKQDIELVLFNFEIGSYKVPVFTLPRLLKPRRDKLFSFLNDIARKDLPANIVRAADMQVSYANFDWHSSAGMFFLYKMMIEEQIREVMPDLVVLWHQFNPYHQVLLHVLHEKKIPVIFGEHGVLPGSYCFERNGQMAESWVTMQKEFFNELPITPDEIDNARAYLKHARTSKANNKGQGKPFMETPVAERLQQEGKPIIFYAGQNDPKAGLAPQGTDRARFHSPIYASTFDALESLARIAKQNDWNLLYKPHPQTTHYEAGNTFSFENNPHIVKVPLDTDIFDCMALADVTVTILSQISYQALIQGHPCVLLGRMQLSGSGCVYEAQFKEQVTSVIEKAVEYGFTGDQQEALDEHTARLIKYYVVQYNEESAEYFTNTVDDVAGFIARSIGMEGKTNLATTYEKRKPIFADEIG